MDSGSVGEEKRKPRLAVDAVMGGIVTEPRARHPSLGVVTQHRGKATGKAEMTEVTSDDDDEDCSMEELEQNVVILEDEIIPRRATRVKLLPLAPSLMILDVDFEQESDMEINMMETEWIELEETEEDSDWTGVIIFGMMLIAVIIGAMMHRSFARVAEPIVPLTRTVATQSQVTYTSLRGNVQPRFLPIAESEQGAFAYGGLRLHAPPPA